MRLPARLLPLAALALAAAPAAAQHSLAPAGGGYDASVPTPRSVLRYELGDRFTTHAEMLRYLERLAAASDRVRLDTLGRTFEGREIVMAVVTSAANHARLAEIRADAQRLAQPAGDAAALAALAERTPAIAWLGFTVHGNEASGTEASLGVLYQLAAGQDARTRLVLDSTVVLIDPLQNPDGHERFVQDNLRLRGAFGVPTTPGAMVHAGNWPGGRTSHYQFDLNRDWFILSHPESQARVATFNTWAPHVAVDLHEMGSNSTYFFAPPMEPVNANVHGSIVKWWDIYAASNAAAFDRQGTAYFRREGYDEFYPGYGVSWPSLTGAVGMTYEQASSAGGAIRRSDGTVLTLRDAASHHYTAAMATLLTTAERRGERVRDYVEFRRTAVSDAARAPYRTVAFGGDGQGRADSLAQLLVRNGIVVGRLRQGIDAPAVPHGTSGSSRASFPAGTYVVDLAQPQGRLARALLEPDARLDSTFIAEELESRRTGRGSRFYDVTAWSLPYAWRVPAWTTSAALGATDPVAATPARTGAIAVTATAPAQARHGYAFAPGSEASIRLLAGLLADSVRVWFAQRPFSAEGRDFPHGAFVVRTAANDTLHVHAQVRRLAAAAGAEVTALASALVDRGTDLGSNSVVPVRAPRVALLGGAPVSGNAFGFAWYAFDQRIGYPTVAVDAGAIAGGILRDFDVLVVPSVGAGALDGALGAGGRERLQSWVQDGGVLIALENAAGWLAREQSGLSSFRARAGAAPDSTGAAPLPAGVPGAVVRVVADTLSPLLAGVADAELPVLVQGERLFAPSRAIGPGAMVLRYAPAPRLRLAGYLWPESAARHAGAPYLWTERAGRGRVIAFAGDPNFRDLWRGLLPVFANAVFLGGTF